MSSTIRRIALLIAMSAAPSCVSTQPYVRPHVRAHASNRNLATIIRSTMTDHGLHVVSQSIEPLEMVALSTPDDSTGALTRDRWLFVAIDGELRVEMHSEVKLEASFRGGWQTVDCVCPTYSYAREREMLREVRRRVRQAAAAELALAAPQSTSDQP